MPSKAAADSDLKENRAETNQGTEKSFMGVVLCLGGIWRYTEGSRLPCLVSILKVEIVQQRRAPLKIYMDN